MSEQDQPLNEKQKKLLQSEYEHVDVPPLLEAKTINRLYESRLINSSSPTWAHIAISLVIIGIIFSAGLFTGHQLSPKKNTIMASTDKKQFMLMLHNTPEFVEKPEYVKEYGDWMKQVAAKDGNELGHGGWLINNNLKEDVAFTASGYFIIEASTAEAAIEIARTCPHIRHKGNIELREIVQH